MLFMSACNHLLLYLYYIYLFICLWFFACVCVFPFGDQRTSFGSQLSLFLMYVQELIKHGPSVLAASALANLIIILPMGYFFYCQTGTLAFLDCDFVIIVAFLELFLQIIRLASDLQRSTCLCHLNAVIKYMYHHTSLRNAIFK